MNRLITYNIFLTTNEKPIIQFYFMESCYWFEVESDKGHIDAEAFKRRLINEYQNYQYNDFVMKFMFMGKISKSDFNFIKKNFQRFQFMNSSNLRGA